MKLIDLTCSKCGAQLKVNPELSKCMCQYCGNEMLIDDEVKHHKLDNGFDFGYQAEMGRLKAQAEYQKQQKEIAEAERQRIENDRKRLFNTPRAQYLLNYCESNFDNKEIALRQQLKYDSQLRYEYENDISIYDPGYREPMNINTKIALIIVAVFFGICILVNIIISVANSDNGQQAQKTQDTHYTQVNEQRVEKNNNKEITNDEEITLSGRLGSALATTCNLRIDGKITSEECRDIQSEIIYIEKELISDSNLNDDSTFISKIEKIEEKLNELEK